MDDLVGIGDIAGLAVDAVRGIDLQFRRALFRHHFVDRRGTKILAGIAEFAHAAVAANVRVEDDQVARLVFVVARAGMIDVGQAVERELAVALEARGLIDERSVRDSAFRNPCSPAAHASDRISPRPPVTNCNAALTRPFHRPP